MDDTDILRGINEVAQTTFGLTDHLEMTTRVADVMALDSLARLRFAVALEDHFDVVLQRADESRLETVFDLVTILRRCIDERPS